MRPTPPRSTLFPYTTLFRSNERAAELATGIKDGKFVGVDQGTIDSFLTDIVLTPGANGTVLTASVDMAKVLEILAQ